MRPSILLSRGQQNVVIDTTPDFRAQALAAKLDRLDAVVLTHGHADHIFGFDDIRPFNIKQKIAMPVHGSSATLDTLRRTFSYAFDPAPLGTAIPLVELHAIDGPFERMGVTFTPVPAEHGDLTVLGFRFGRAAYLTDFSRVSDSSKKLLTDLDDFILDALRNTPHPMHQTVEQAIALVHELKPRRAWFTHISHELPHAATNERLAALGLPNVQLAYDGLEFEVTL
jgi:phosphoribosyl 1,2-cyclic phosphate phosphodiesterase